MADYDTTGPSRRRTRRSALTSLLFREQKRLASIIEHSADGILLIDEEGLVQFANPAAQAMLGRLGPDMQALPFGVPPGDDPLEVDIHKPGGENMVAEVRRTDVEIEARPAYILVIRDITGRKRVEDELEAARMELEARYFDRTRELSEANERLKAEIAERRQAQEDLARSEARFKAILEDQQELICRYLPDGRLSYVNEAYARFHGLDRDELVGRAYMPDIPEEDLGVIREATARLSVDDPVTTFEHRVIRPGGEVVWQSWTHRAIFGEDGSLDEFQAVGRDITRQRQAEEQLRQSREFLRLIIDTVPSPIFVKDREGRFTLVNKAMADLYGGTPGELIGHKGADFNPDAEEVTRFLHEDTEVLDSRQPLFIPEKTITDASGKKRWFTKTKLPLPGQDLVLGVAVDVTDMIEAQEEHSRLEKSFRQAQKMQALGTLAGGIAHDFNNMIFAILGFTRLAMRQSESGSKSMEYLEMVESAGLRASELVRQILTFSRQTEQERMPVRVGTLVKETGKMLQATLPPEVEMAVDVATDEDLVLGDPTQIQQVVMNLCTNAAHAMRETGGRLELSLLPLPEAEGCPRRLEIRVRDTGHGMDIETMERIFDPFFTTKDPGEGTGMGLAVVHGIVENHGGEIRVQSVPGEGTAFHVLLNVFEGDEEDASCESRPVPTGTERILFVDDEEILNQMVGEMLGGLGYDVAAYTSPTRALHDFMADPQSFDLVMCDLAMPEMTGGMLADEILAIREDIPVILVTGFFEDLDEERAKAGGISAILMKPVVEAQLAQAVRTALDDARAERSAD